MSLGLHNFSRETEAAIRLYLQHWIFKFEAEFLLHPTIPLPQSSALKVLDIGCGTGLWLLDAAKLLPKAQLDGFDLSTAHFPPKDELPENVRLWQQDACKPFPIEFNEKYDIVHIGRLHTYFGDENLPRVVESVRSVLKPGGFLQWDEIDVSAMHAAKYDSSKQFPSWERLIQLINSWLKSQKATAGSLDEIPKLLDAHGFKTQCYKRWEPSKVMSKPWTDMQLIAIRDYMNSIIIPMLENEGAQASDIEEWRSLKLAVDKEVVEQGLRILMDMAYAVAQRLP